MKKRHSFRRRLFAGFLLASLLPLLLCSAMLLQIFRLRLDSQLEEAPREQLDHVISSLDGLYQGFQQTALALQASPYVAPALSRGQRDSTTVYSELYSATEGSRLSAQFDLYDRDGVWMYSTGSGPVEPVMPTQWGVLYAARQSVGLAFTQVDGGEGNSAPLFRGAARIAGEAGEDAGYLVITLTRADFQRLLEGTYGGPSTPARPPWPAAWLSSCGSSCWRGRSWARRGRSTPIGRPFRRRWGCTPSSSGPRH